MEPATWFTLANGLAICGWLLLALAPRWKWTTALIVPILIPGVLAVAYAALIVSGWHSIEGGVRVFSSLANVKRLFQHDVLLLAGWLHYLAFDLFVGCWQVRDSARLGIRHLLVVPCLFFTFMLGPVGLLLYLLLRGLSRRRWTLEACEL